MILQQPPRLPFRPGIKPRQSLPQWPQIRIHRHPRVPLRTDTDPQNAHCGPLARLGCRARARTAPAVIPDLLRRGTSPRPTARQRLPSAPHQRPPPTLRILLRGPGLRRQHPIFLIRPTQTNPVERKHFRPTPGGAQIERENGLIAHALHIRHPLGFSLSPPDRCSHHSQRISACSGGTT